MTHAERQLLILVADTLRCLWLNATISEDLAEAIIAARHALDAEAVAEARRTSLQASHGTSGVNPLPRQAGTASDAHGPGTGMVRRMRRLAEWAETYDGEIAGAIRDVLDGGGEQWDTPSTGIPRALDA